ncbi:MAG: MBL fold metallo-hydrolase, partial [Acidimicrobiia bacterium]|nr:MBL fold metallo-hydrolase [Acidimicrobiia bacterium]
AGGAAAVAARASELGKAGNLRLACHLAEWAAQAAPDDPEVLEVRADVYRQRRDQEQSLMSRGIYNDASQS